MQPPPGAGTVGRGRQRAARGRAEAGASAGEEEHDDHGEQHGDGVGEEAGDPPGVGLRDVLVLDRAAGGEGLGVTLGGEQTAALGDVRGLVARGRDQVTDGVQAVTVGQPPGREQATRARGRAAGAGAALAAGGPHDPRTHGQQGGQLVQRLARRAHQEVTQHPKEGAEHEPDDQQRQLARRGVGQQRVERAAALVEVGVPPGQGGAPHAAVGGLGVEDHRLRDDEGRATGRGRPPPEVEVVAEERQPVVETAELLEDRAAHEQTGGVHGQHPAYVVVLALVVLPALQAGLAAAGGGDGDADLEQAAQRGPLTQLGAEQVGLGVLARGGQQPLQRVGGGRGVVVEDPQPLRVAGLRGRDPDGLREAGARRQRTHDAEGALQQVGPLVAAAGVDADHAVGGAGLAAQPLDHDGQPTGSVVADEEDGDRARSRLRHRPGHDRQA